VQGLIRKVLVTLGIVLRPRFKLFKTSGAYSQSQYSGRTRVRFRQYMGRLGPDSAQAYSIFSFFLFLLDLENS
jgi:hypothetical protein